LPCTCAIEHRAEQHVDEDVRGRHAKRDAEHAFSRQPLVREHPLERRALVREHVGQIAAEQDVAEESQCEDRHRQANRAPCRFEQEHEPDGRGNDVDRGRLSGAHRELVVEQDEIGARERGRKREQPSRARESARATSASAPESKGNRAGDRRRGAASALRYR
jgi:hypothetical protein